MNNKIFSASFLALLAIVFVIISFLVLVSRGNSSLIKRKLKIGALIISLTAVLNGCSGDDGTAVCYSSSPVNEITLNGADAGTASITAAAGDSLGGLVEYREATAFSYAIFDSSNNLISSGDISASDGAFDSDSENIFFTLSASLTDGTYNLRLYSSSYSAVSDTNASKISFTLIIEN